MNKKHPLRAVQVIADEAYGNDRLSPGSSSCRCVMEKRGMLDELGYARFPGSKEAYEDMIEIAAAHADYLGGAEVLSHPADSYGPERTVKIVRGKIKKIGIAMAILEECSRTPRRWGRSDWKNSRPDQSVYCDCRTWSEHETAHGVAAA